MLRHCKLLRRAAVEPSCRDSDIPAHPDTPASGWIKLNATAPKQIGALLLFRHGKGMLFVGRLLPHNFGSTPWASGRISITSSIPINMKSSSTCRWMPARPQKSFFRPLVQPAIDLAPLGSHVVAVADSKIYSLNFETFISSEGADHYGIEDVKFHKPAQSICWLLTNRDANLPGLARSVLRHRPIFISPNYPMRRRKWRA